MIDSIKLARAVEAGVEAERNTGLPRELTVCQWALESGWGEFSPKNNCFGIKSYPGCAGEQELLTTEVRNGVSKKIPQWFATFPDLGSCFLKHAQLITDSPRYSMPWNQYLDDNDLHGLILGIAPIYATDPDYSTKLFSILAMPEVKAALGT